jgi:hypothetical protein
VAAPLAGPSYVGLWRAHIEALPPRIADAALGVIHRENVVAEARHSVALEQPDLVAEHLLAHFPWSCR